MCKRTPSVNYVYKKIHTTKKSEIYRQLEDSPLSVHDYAFICDVIAGLNLKELSAKYHKSYSRVSQWKREVCEKVHAFDLANLKR